MHNFVILDMPDFVLIQASENDDVQRPEGEPTFLNNVFNDIFQTLGVRMNLSREADPVHFFRATRPRIRFVLAQYGFERLPRTLGELCGLFDYCDRLDVITGIGVFEPEMHARWQQLTFELSGQRTGTPHRPAIELYRRGDSAALLAWHSEQDVLTELGRAYRHVPGR